MIDKDNAITDAPVLMDFHKKVDVRHIDLSYSSQIPERAVILYKSNRDVFFTDILINPVLLFSESTNEIVNLYDPYLESKKIVLLDPYYGISKMYYLPILHKVECLSPNSLLNTAKTVLLKAVLISSKTPNKPIFQMKFSQNIYTIVREDLAESMLCNNCTGLNLILVEMEES